jgi:hypothetical protein
VHQIARCAIHVIASIRPCVDRQDGLLDVSAGCLDRLGGDAAMDEVAREFVFPQL